MDQLVENIRAAQSFILTTHRQCDGDGLGAEMALFFALKKLNKKVVIYNVDETPKKYRYLNPDFHIQYHNQKPANPGPVDLTLIFDTNDHRLLEPLYSDVIAKNSKMIAFIDHHPILKNGPSPSKESFIDISAASTGEITYKIIQKLGIPMDTDIAKAIYTSITFDTQLYRYIRSSPISHQIAAKMLEFPIDPTMIHRHLFGNQTVNKVAFLAKALGQIEYFCDGQIALLKLRDSDLFHYNMEPDDSRDVIDMIMNIESIEAAALFREDATDTYKLSLRSKGQINVLGVAESVGGGGHDFSAGAFIKGSYEDFKSKIVKQLTQKLSVS